jgi:galacturonosyltransferase
MKEKGIDDFLAAAKHFKQSGDKDVEFHVIGMCEENYVKILNDLHENGIIVYHGRQKDVRPFIEKASCLIHPTFYPEGMSNVILEAASTGRPVITTRRYGCMEAVDENVTGFLFEERNRQELFQAIEKFLKMSCSQQADMGAMGRKKMEKEFDRQIVVDAYLDEISKITNKDNTQI